MLHQAGDALMAKRQTIAIQQPLFAVPSTWRPPKISDLPSWKGVKRLGLDTETHDPRLKKRGGLPALGIGVRRDGRLIGVSFAIEDGPAHYLPLFHHMGDNVEDPQQALNYLRDNAKYFTGSVVGAHLQYDLDYTEENGILFPKAKDFRDVQVADPLINALHQSYTLEAIAERWGLPGKDESALREAAWGHGLDPKADMHLLAARHVGIYATQDAVGPLGILRRQEREIENLNLEEVWALETAVLPVLLKMRRRGVLIDHDRLDRIEAWTIKEEQQCLDRIKELTGLRLMLGEVSVAGALAPVLRSIGVQLPKTPKTGKDKIDVNVLAQIHHPVGDAVRRGRKMESLRSKFVASTRRFEVKGRIHATFNQGRTPKSEDSGEEGTEGAGFGRLSCVMPNLQNQPARDDFAKDWRGIYRPEPGKQWASLDFSSQEPRLMVHLAIERGRLLMGDDAYESALKAAEEYHNDRTMSFHARTAGILGWEGEKGTKRAKTIGLGLAYGMGEAKLCVSVGLPLSMAVWDRDAKERVYIDVDKSRYELICAQGGIGRPAAGPAGRKVLTNFNASVPFVKRLAEIYTERAADRGMVRTLSGRVCHFPEKRKEARRHPRDRFEWTHKAGNRAIQGSAGDQMKMALVALDHEGCFLQLQIHDEATASVDDRSEAERYARIMEEVMPMHVPSKVDIEIGPSWGEAS